MLLLAGLGDSISDNLAQWQSLMSQIASARQEMAQAFATAPAGSALNQNFVAYDRPLEMAYKALNNDSAVKWRIMAGGDASDYAMRMVNAYQALLRSRYSMFKADLADSSGQQSYQIAAKEHDALMADSIKRDEAATFWAGVTNIDNPFSPVSMLGSVKGLAVAALVIGGLIMAFPSIMSGLGSYQAARERGKGKP